MSSWIGDLRVGKTVRKMWNSSAVAGESITRATNGTISVYKDGGTTQSTTGVTDTEDFDGLTGVHLVAIDTSADGTFYSAGSDFEVVLSAATIDGKAINATLFSFSLENRSALMPTTDGRRLDVSTGGEAGVDWANVGSPATALSLSGTTVKTATDVETDTQDIQGRLPAALVSGRIDASVGAMATDVLTSGALAAGAVTEMQAGLATSAALATVQADTDDIQSRLPAALVSGRIDASVGAMASGVLTAAAIAADAITDAKVASDVTIASVTGAVGSVTGNVGGNVTGSVGSVATGGITAVSFTAGAIDSAAIAADAIGASELATSAVAEIQAGLSTLDAAGVRTALGLASANLDTQIGDLPTNSEIATSFGTVNATLATVVGYIDTEILAIKTVTDRVSGMLELDGSVYRYTVNALEQAPLGGGGGGGATPAEIADAVWDEMRVDHAGAGSFGEGAGVVLAEAVVIPTANQNADALLDRVNGVETGWTVRQAARIVLSVLSGKASGQATSTAKFRDMADTKDRIVATVDEDGDRTAVIRDPS